MYGDFSTFLLDENERYEPAKRLKNYDKTCELIENPFEDILIWIKSELLNIAAFKAAFNETSMENETRKNKLLSAVKAE